VGGADGSLDTARAAGAAQARAMAFVRFQFEILNLQGRSGIVAGSPHMVLCGVGDGRPRRRRRFFLSAGQF